MRTDPRRSCADTAGRCLARGAERLAEAGKRGSGLPVTTLITQSLLVTLSEEAVNSSRRRKNRNFHPRDDYPGHRLLNAIEPDSYVMPHRHLDPTKDETILCLRGKLGILVFSPNGAVHRSSVLEAGGAILGVDIPHGQFHSVIAL